MYPFYMLISGVGKTTFIRDIARGWEIKKAFLKIEGTYTWVLSRDKTLHPTALNVKAKCSD